MKRFNKYIKYLIVIVSLLIQIFFIAGCEDSFTPIVPRTLEPLLEVSIEGDPITKEELVAITNPADATASYQWLMATEENGDYEEIPEATNKTFRLTEEYLTKFIRVKATGKGEYVGIVASAPLGPISKPNYYRIYTYKQNIDDDEYTLESNEIIEEKVGTEIIANYEEIEGFIPNLTHPNRVESGAVRKTNRLYLRLYYDRATYNVNFETDGGTEYQPKEEIKYGSKIDNPDSDNPKKTGYTFGGWFEDSDFTTPWNFGSSVVTGETTLYVKWNPNTDTAYKVEHYRKELASADYVLSRTDDFSGTTGELTTATAVDYIGFTAQPISQKTIAANGSTTVEIYYDRNEYALTYEITGDFFGEELFSTEIYEYEAKVTAVEKPTQVGYVFEGWSNVPNTMPARDVVATGYYRPSGNTRYKVEHYRENVLGDTYTEFETETLTGTTGTKSAAVAKTYSGFSAQPFEQLNIAPDGSTTVRINYSRNTYSLTYGIAGNFFADPSYEVIDYKFGSPIIPLESPMQSGYSFEGWSGIPATMPAREVTATGYYTANTDTAYQVEHYLKDLGADTYTLMAEDTEIKSGTSAQLTTAVANDYEGFTANKINQKIIVGDGSTIVEIYYERNKYALTYAVEGSFFSDASHATAVYEYEANVVATVTPSQVGYTFVGWDDVPATMPAKDVTATGYYTANTDTAYKVEHYLKDLGANTYTLKDSDNLTGTTGEDTSAVAKDYTGFTVEPFNQLVIAADGSTTLKIYYDRNKYTLTYAIEGSFFSDASYEIKVYEYEADVVATATPSQMGYTFVGWDDVPATMPAKDVTATGYYTANTDTAYKVEHYLRDLGANTYSLKDSDNLTGTTGEDTNAVAKAYTGFTVEPFNQQAIAADGTTTVKVYYERNKYILTYAVEGSFFSDASHATAVYEYEADVVATVTPSQVGYTFVGWDDVPATMPAKDATATGYYTANTDTAYKVEYYLRDLGANTYSLKDSDNLTGTTGEDTSAVAKAYTGFTVEPFNQQVIAADGSTIVKIYYDRNKYTLTYAVEGSFFSDASHATAVYEYEAAVVAVAQPNEVGYIFVGWSDVPKTMPANNVTATGYYRPSSNTRYTVVHYQEDVTGDTYTEIETETLIGTTGEKSEAIANTYSGFSAQPFNQLEIAPDGSTIVRINYNRNIYSLTYRVEGNFFTTPSYEVADYKFGTSIVPLANPEQQGYTFAGWTGVPLTMPAHNVVATGYYTANTDTAYTVEHYLKDLGGNTYTLKDSDNLSGTTGEDTNAVAKAYTGFTVEPFNQEAIAADGSTTLKIYYDRNKYTLTYAVEGSFFSDASYATSAYEYEADVVATATPSQVGYTFVGWDDVPATMPARDVTATGYYTANTDTAYKVEHYLKDLGANTYSLKNSDNLTGTTGEDTSAVAKAYTGFTVEPFNQEAIAADGSTIVKVYYERNKYTLTYAIEGSFFSDASYETEVYEYEADVVATATPSRVGYTFVGWNDVPVTMPAKDVTATGYYTANTDTVYKVEHYLKDLGANTYSLKDSDNLTGTTGEDTNAVAKAYTGFTVEPFNQLVIAADGSTTVKVYYERNKYTLTYAVEGSFFSDASHATAVYEYEAGVVGTATPSRVGYTFVGWDDVPATMPAKDVTATGYYTANTDTVYKIEHYLKDLGVGTYTLKDIVSEAGTTGQLTEAEAKSYVGFTVQGITQEAIAGDGSTIVEIYYERNKYNLTYSITGELFSDASHVIQTYEYEAEVTSADKPSEVGYTFVGWNDVPDSMPANNVTATGYYRPSSSTGYIVKHYQEDLVAGSYTVFETENSTGTTGEESVAIANTYSGFSVQPFNQQAIAADGSTVVEIYYNRNTYNLAYGITGSLFANPSYAVESYKFGASIVPLANPGLQGYTFSGWENVPATMPSSNVTVTGYYTANTDTAYKVEHYLKDLGANTYSLKDSDNLTGTTGEDTSAVSKDYTGFTVEPFDQQAIAANGSTNVKIYYDRNKYTLTYAIEGSFFSDASHATAVYEYEADVVATATPSQMGYTFVGWDDVPATMPAKDVTATGYYTANTDTAYKVEHYLRDLGANTYTLKDSDNLTGITGEDTNAVAKAYTGFTVEPFNQQAIAADGTTTVKVYYERNKYILTYAVEGSFFSDASHATAVYEYEADVVATVTPSQVGYTFVGWDDVPATMPAKDVTATGYYTANTDTAYKVEHYLKDLGVGTYTLKDTVSEAGTTEQLTEAEAKSYVGFAVQGITQEAIAGDGSTIVEIYYERNIYSLTYAIEGSFFSDASYVTQTYEYEAEVTSAGKPSQVGYTFIGWQDVPGKMPAGNVTATGHYTANTNTAYKVEHYLKDLGTETYTLVTADTDNKTGTTAQYTAAEAKVYTGFSVQEFTQKIIAGDGSTVVKIYYDRNKYSLTYAIEGSFFDDASYATQMYEYEAGVTSVGRPLHAGYAFVGWTAVPTTMPAQNVTATGYYTANTDTAYKVEHYLKDLGAETYTFEDSVNRTGTTAQLTEAEAKSYTGFTAQGITQETIAGDGSTVVKIYYNRILYIVSFDSNGGSEVAGKTVEYQGKVTQPVNPDRVGYTFSEWYKEEALENTWEFANDTVTGNTTLYARWLPNENTAYKVEHYLKDLGTETYTLVTADTVNKTGTTAQLTAAEAKSYTGFTAQGITQEAIAGDGSTVVKIYYDRNKYSLTYAIEGSFFDDASYATQMYEYEAGVTSVGKPSEVGYTFVGWTAVPTTMPAQNVTATGYYTANTDTAYKVEHYLKDLGVETYTLEDSVNRTGTTAQLTEAEAKSYTGFTAQGVTQETIAGDGSTVVKIYYNRLLYTVSFDSNGGTEVAGKTVEYQGKVTQPVNPDRVGYTFSEWYKEEALENTWEFANDTVTGNTTLYARWLPNENTAYKVEHYLKDLGAETYTLEDSVNRTGTTAQYTAAEAKSYTGFTAQGITQEAIAGDGSTVVKIYYNRILYTVSFNSNGGTEVANATVEYQGEVAKPVDPTRVGHTFDKWYTDELQTIEYDFNTIVVADITLHSGWNKIIYSLNYLPGTLGSLAGNTSQSVPYGEDGEEVEARPIDGYHFTEWSDGSTDNPRKDINISGNITVTAKYSINVYTVKYVDWNGGILLEINDVNHGGRVDAPANPSRVGHSFKGWDADSEYVISDMTINPIYEAHKYIVDFNSNGGGPVASQIISYGEKVENPVNPQKVGYTLGGWFSEESLDSESEWKFNDHKVTEDITLFAGWVPNDDTPYTVKHYLKDLGADTYTIVADDTLEDIGTTGQLTEAVANSYDGFKVKDFVQEEIAGDGTTLVEIFYDRNLYNVTFNGLKKKDVSGNVDVEELKIVQVEYEASVEVSDLPNPSEPNYQFLGWYGDYTNITDDKDIFALFVEKENGKYIIRKDYTDNSKTSDLIGDIPIAAGINTDGLSLYNSTYYSQQGGPVISSFNLSNGGTTFLGYVKATGNGYADFEGDIVFKYGSVTVGNNNDYYTIEEALQKANSGTVFVKYNTSFAEKEIAQQVYGSSSHEVKSGVTLLVPYDKELSLEINDTPGNNPGNGIVDDSAYVELVLPSNITLDVNGTLIVNAKRANTGTMYQGFVNESFYALLRLEAGSKINVNNKLSAIGFIYGDGEIEANPASNIEETLFVKSFRGGTATSSVQSKVFPFDQFTLNNIESKLIINSGAVLEADAMLWVSRTYQKEAKLNLLGNTDKYLLNLSDGKIIKQYDQNSGHITLTLEGEATLNDGSISLGIVSADSAGKDMPFDGTWHFVVSGNSTMTLNSWILLLPGASMNIEQNGVLELVNDARLTVFNPYEQMGSYLKYPNTNAHKYNRTTVDFDFDEKTPALLKNKGTIVLNGNKIAGRIGGTGLINWGSKSNPNYNPDTDPYDINYVMNNSDVLSRQVRYWGEDDTTISVTKSLESHTIGNKGNIQLEVLVKDSNNEPLSGIVVDLTTTNGKGSFDEESYTTNNNGKVVAIYTTNDEAEEEGTLVLTATATSLGISANAKIEVKKSGGGSACPLVYSFDGSDYIREHEPVTYSVNSAFEDTTFGTLRSLQDIDGIYNIRITEEMESETYLNAFNLYTVDYQKGSTNEIFADIYGNPRTIKERIYPTSFVDSNGTSWLTEIITKGALVESDVSNLERGKYVESYVATFERPVVGTREAKLMLSTIVTKLVDGFGGWFAEMINTEENVWWIEKALAVSPDFIKYLDALSMLTMKIEIWDGEEWIEQAYINGGSHILEDFLIPIDLSHANESDEEIKVRFSSGSGFYIIDQVSIDFSDDVELKVQELELVTALRNGNDEVGPIIDNFENNQRVKLQKGEYIDLYYKKPILNEGDTRGYMVAFTGYFHAGVRSVENAIADLWENMNYEEIVEAAIAIQPDAREVADTLNWMFDLAGTTFGQTMENKIENIYVKYALPWMKSKFSSVDK